MPRRCCTRKPILFTMVGILFLLALGLGLGLGLRHQRPVNDRRPQATQLPSPDPTTTSRPPGHHPDWTPKVRQSWQIVLISPLEISGNKISPDVDVYDVDLFDNDAATFTALREKGKKSICYFSAGSYEPGRPDSKDFQEGDMGKGLDGWPGEKWLNVSSPSVRSIMSKRIELAAKKGCHAIDPDNVDGFVSV
jgi:glycosyl hydrolase family 114